MKYLSYLGKRVSKANLPLIPKIPHCSESAGIDHIIMALDSDFVARSRYRLAKGRNRINLIYLLATTIKFLLFVSLPNTSFIKDDSG